LEERIFLAYPSNNFSLCTQATYLKKKTKKQKQKQNLVETAAYGMQKSIDT